MAEPMADHMRLYGRRLVAVVPGSEHGSRVLAIDLQERAGRRMHLPTAGLSELPAGMQPRVTTDVQDRAWAAACREVEGPGVRS